MTKRALKEFDKLTPEIQKKIGEKLDKFEESSKDWILENCKKLVAHTNVYRIKVDNYRIVFELEDAILKIIVIIISHRKDVYEKLKRLF